MKNRPPIKSGKARRMQSIGFLNTASMRRALQTAKGRSKNTKVYAAFGVVFCVTLNITVRNQITCQVA